MKPRRKIGASIHQWSDTWLLSRSETYHQVARFREMYSKCDWMVFNPIAFGLFQYSYNILGEGRRLELRLQNECSKLRSSSIFQKKHYLKKSIFTKLYWLVGQRRADLAVSAHA